MTNLILFLFYYIFNCRKLYNKKYLDDDKIVIIFLFFIKILINLCSENDEREKKNSYGCYYGQYIT